MFFIWIYMYVCVCVWYYCSPSWYLICSTFFFSCLVLKEILSSSTTLEIPVHLFCPPFFLPYLFMMVLTKCTVVLIHPQNNTFPFYCSTLAAGSHLTDKCWPTSCFLSFAYHWVLVTSQNCFYYYAFKFIYFSSILTALWCQLTFSLMEINLYCVTAIFPFPAYIRSAFKVRFFSSN